MKRPSSEKLVRIACIFGLIALPLMVWSVVDPRVWPVLVALSIGQVIGTFSFALYLFVVVRDLGVFKRLRSTSQPPNSLLGASLPPSSLPPSSLPPSSQGDKPSLPR